MKKLEINEMFPKGNNSARSALNELVTRHSLLVTKTAFTMAEILLSLTIIGVVAAITLPSLTGNINERTWNTQRKALYSRMSQAISLMPALNGYGTLDGTTDNAAETFITNGLSKVLKINNICGSGQTTDCGIPLNIATLDAQNIEMPLTMSALKTEMVGTRSDTGGTITLLNSNAAAFETQNGESIIVYYNPRCIGVLKEDVSGPGGLYVGKRVCANFIYDLNGKKGPNTVGKDIGFMTLLYPSDPVLVAPYPATRPLSSTHKFNPADASEISGAKACSNFDTEYRLPNAEELVSMAMNIKLLANDTFAATLTDSIMSSSLINSNELWGVYLRMRLDSHNTRTKDFHVWCVKR